MSTLAETLYHESHLGELLDLPRAGSTLEHPLVYDATARDIKPMADKGLVEIVDEHQSLLGGEWVIDRLQFGRLRS